MAKKQSYISSSQDPVVDLIESEASFIEEVIKPAVEDHLTQQIKQYIEKGWDDNRIAARLMIHKHKVIELRGKK